MGFFPRRPTVDRDRRVSAGSLGKRGEPLGMVDKCGRDGIGGVETRVFGRGSRGGTPPAMFCRRLFRAPPCAAAKPARPPPSGAKGARGTRRSRFHGKRSASAKGWRGGDGRRRAPTRPTRPPFGGTAQGGMSGGVASGNPQGGGARQARGKGSPRRPSAPVRAAVLVPPRKVCPPAEFLFWRGDAEKGGCRGENLAGGNSIVGAARRANIPRSVATGGLGG